MLGDRFEALPPVLRRFHGHADARAVGIMRVERGRGWIVRLAAWVMGVPPSSERADVELRVTVVDGREVWTRHFSLPNQPRQRPMVSRQWCEGAWLVEAFGPSRTYFELESEPNGMRFVQRRCTILGIPLPSILAPRAHARASSSDGEGWEVEVRIMLPVVGLLVEYAGRLIPDA